jgi:hypothetical protein
MIIVIVIVIFGMGVLAYCAMSPLLRQVRVHDIFQFLVRLGKKALERLGNIGIVVFVIEKCSVSSSVGTGIFHDIRGDGITNGS